MFKKKYRFRCFTTLILIAVVTAVVILATIPAGARSAAAPGPEERRENLSVLMVIDVSGSMAHTDPDMLRETASHIFIDLLSPEDYLGVITFDDKAEVIIPLQQIKTSAAKEEFKTALSSRLQPHPRGNTNFKTALEQAWAQFQETEITGFRPVVVLLTDGEPDPDPRRRKDPAFMASHLESMWAVVSGFTREEYPIYTVGFSDEIDPEVIRRMSQETRGEYYLLDGPAPLVETFFKLLGTLKNRRVFLEESYDLSAGPQTLEFTINDFTHQLNLVLVNPSGKELDLSVTPPSGKPEEIKGLTVNKTEKYSLLILHAPDESMRGKWKVSLSGRGRVKSMGDMDLAVKAWLEHPHPSSQHPLNEPLDFRVLIKKEGVSRDVPVEAEIWLSKPGETHPAVIPLTEEKDGYFTGQYSDINREGEYEVLIRVLLDGEAVSAYPTRLIVKAMPTLATDFWLEKKYRAGEEHIISASLNMAGNRLAESRELAVDKFEFILRYEDGKTETVPLYDSGNMDEHGDVRAADGIWSGRFRFTGKGLARAGLLAAGKYRDGNFMLEKNLGMVEVYAPGRVLVRVSDKKFWSAPGGKLSIPIRLSSESRWEEILTVEQGSDAVKSIKPLTISLTPGETKHVTLTINLDRNLDIKTHTLPLTFTAKKGSAVEPSSWELQADIMPRGEALRRKFYPVMTAALRVFTIIAPVALLIYLGGLILYRILVFPDTKVRGRLLYRKTKEQDTEMNPPQELDLKKLAKGTAVISFDPKNKEADYIIEESEFSHDMLIETLARNLGPRFIQGWKALTGKNQPIKTEMRCTRPGIIEFEGEIYTRKGLFHADKFASGEYTFQYLSDAGRRTGVKTGNGTNILKGKI